MADAELFSVPETKSPRLKWMERHGVAVREFPERAADPGAEDMETGKELWPWEAFKLSTPTDNGLPSIRYGAATQDEALAAWARANGQRMWFEEVSP